MNGQILCRSRLPAVKIFSRTGILLSRRPLGVFFHELGHALAVWFFGGTVVGFNFRFFWGEVEHFGVYTLPERWLISLAGTLGSLLFGLGVWLALRHNRVSSLRYFGLRAFRFQIYFSLLYYPLFSIILPIGDWRVIYDFAATPILSSVTLVVHLLFLAAYWLYDRQGSFEAPAMDSQPTRRSLTPWPSRCSTIHMIRQPRCSL
ncbi:MAG: M50 family metallopeptidase [Chloroflexi bacterium]|nr:M50 family metallopeptidase [Chloroflexota bacterium]